MRSLTVRGFGNQFEAFGVFLRRAAVDIGFGSLIEKFEEHVGVRPTRVLIFVVFVAVLAFCARAIFDNLISPLLVFFRTPVWGTTLIEIGVMALSVGLGMAAGAQALAAFKTWRSTKKARQILNDVQALQDRLETIADERIAELEPLLAEVRQANEENSTLLRAVIEVAQGVIEREAATDEEREKLRAEFRELGHALSPTEGNDDA